jgi:alkylation response protein AidB-like acyl-CoA dehydrogenase
VGQSLSDEQDILRKSARDFLARRYPLASLAVDEFRPGAFDHATWLELSEMGWLGITLPERLGGGGGSLVDLAVICEEFGRALAPAPFLPIAVAAVATLERIPSRRADALLTQIATGQARPVLAVAGKSGQWRASANDVLFADGRLNGTKRFVEAGHLADSFITTAVSSDDTIHVLLVDADCLGVTVRALPMMSGAQFAEVEFEDAPAESLLSGWNPIDAALCRVAAMQAAWCAGAATRLLQDTVAYVSERHQFGVPIGSFQAVQHRLADCDIAVTEAESLARYAAELLNDDAPEARRLASTAFVRAADAFVEVSRSCHQVWGGMGFCTEADVHLFSRRAKVAQMNWGGPDYHLEVIAEELHGMPLLRDRYATALRCKGIEL